MPKAPFWYDEPMAWDALYVGAKGAVAPGIVEDIRVNRVTKLDKKTAPGANGATITFQGYELATVEITMKLWRDVHLERLRLLLEAVLPKPGKEAPKARDFVHPVLALHGIKSLFVEEVDGPGMPDAEGIVRYTLRCVEFAPPPKKPATSTPKSSAAVPGGSATVFPTAPGATPLPAGTFGPPSPPSAAGKPPLA